MKTVIIIIMAVALVALAIAYFYERKTGDELISHYQERCSKIPKLKEEIERLESKIADIQKHVKVIRKIVVLDGDAEVVQKKIEDLEADGYTFEIQFPSTDLASFVKRVVEEENKPSEK